MTDQETTKPRYLTCAETAKLVRKALKGNFPNTKFSVRSHNYAGGASIDIRWIDGPTTKEVHKVTDPYSSKDFDASIDLACHWKSWLMPDGTATTAQGSGTVGSLGFIPRIDNPKPHDDAELVSFGADYIHSDRNFSVAFLTRIAAKITAHYRLPMPKVYADPHGAFINVLRGNAGIYMGGHYSLADLIYQEAYKTSA